MERAGLCDPDEEGRSRKIWTRGGKMHEALTFSEKEPASGREGPRSDGVRAGEP